MLNLVRPDYPVSQIKINASMSNSQLDIDTHRKKGRPPSTCALEQLAGLKVSQG